MKVLMKYQFDGDFKKIERQAVYARYRILTRIGAILRGTARRMIAPSKLNPYRKITGKKYIPSPVGKPYRRGTGFLRDSIVFETDKTDNSVTLGYYRGWETAQLHELSGFRGGNFYPARPVVMVSIDKAAPTIQKLFPAEYKKIF